MKADERTVAIATNLAAELDEVANRLRELQADAQAINYHVAVLRIERFRDGLRTTIHGVRQQTGKLRSRIANEEKCLA